MNKSLIGSVIAAAVLTVAGCSSMGSGGGAKVVDGTGNGGNGASSSGIGNQSRFNGQNGNNTRLVAPHDQTYHFKFDNSGVESKDLASIRAQARYLASHPKAHILLAGNTDERGSREYNVALGERRAKSIEDTMLLEGVKRNQIRVLSYGQERPVAFGHDESSYRLNRRVDLTYEATR